MSEVDDRLYLSWPQDVEYVAKDYGDWVACVWKDGLAVAFNRETKRFYRLPDPNCPVIVVDWEKFLRGKT